MVSIPGVTTANVFIQAPQSFAGEVGTVTLRIRPSQWLVHTGTGTPLASFVIPVTPADGATAEVELPHTDQPGFEDSTGTPVTGWTYDASIQFRLGNELQALPPKKFSLPSTVGASADLATIPASTATATGSGNIDGGNASTVYTETIDGGTA